MLNLPVLLVNSVILSDSFNRADSPTTLGKTDSGQSYQVLAGTWGTVSNTARVITSSGSTDRVFVNSYVCDFAIDITFPQVAPDQRVIFRATDLNNEWEFGSNSAGNYFLAKRVAGSRTNMASSSVVLTNGDNLRVVCVGSTIQAYVNNVQLFNIVDSFNQTATSVGLYSTASTSTSFKSLRVEAL